MKHQRITRRAFVRGAAAAVAAPYVVSSSALGLQDRPAASERIVMATIGCGGRGTQDMKSLLAADDVQMVATCDVVRGKREAAKRAVDQKYGNGDCRLYRDLREVLGRADIDAVLIATGDNWHSLAAVMAARAGKDMYCEKPMSVSLTEGRVLCNAMERYGVVFQCGTQRRSVPRFKFAVDLARDGKLGELKTLFAEKSPDWFNGHHERTLPAEPQPSPEEIDWDMWLGPAPWRPYNAGYIKRNFWGGHRDFAGGPVTEWGSHTVDLCQWANGADDTTPVEYDVIEGVLTARYANGVKLIFEEGKWPLHVRFVGTEGSVYVDDDGNIEVEPKSLIAGRKFGRGYPQGNHVRNFLDCVKSRRRPIAPPEGAHRANSACQIANICLQLGRKLEFDPKTEKFVNDPMADRKLFRATRDPWQI